MHSFHFFSRLYSNNHFQKGYSMEKNLNLNSATEHVSQARESDIKTTFTDSIADAIPGSSSPAAIKQQGFYTEDDKAAPDNNPFFTKRSNPLSSKGN